MFQKVFWNYYAKVYDSLFKLRPYRQMLEDVVSWADIQPGMRILDLGCGTGNLEQVLAERKVECEVIGLDYSSEMLKRARRKSKKNTVTFIETDLKNIHAALSGVEPFDRVISVNVLYAIEDPQELLEASRQYLKSQAFAVHSTPAEFFEWKQIFIGHVKKVHGWHYLQLGALLPQLTMVLILNLLLFKKEAQNKYHFHSKDEIITLFKNSGYGDTSLRRAYANQNWLIKAEN